MAPAKTQPSVTVATAGWAVPVAVAEQFPAEGSGLQRYGARLPGVEINSTFYRSHRASTFERWAADTPVDFRFAVKLPKAITHVARLLDAADLLAAFRREVRPLQDKLGPLLVQLPPSLAFDAAVATAFFTDLREIWPELVVCEPRHASWFGDTAEALLVEHRIGRVAADPAPHPAAAMPGGWPGIAYWRLHGSPRMYRSPYDRGALTELAGRLAGSKAPAWCVFDNTASGAAAANALELRSLLIGQSEDRG